MTLQSTEAWPLTAADTATRKNSGPAALAVYPVGRATHFGVFTRGRTLPGVAIPVLVVALDACNQRVAGYTGTVRFTSSDPTATLPADYTFTPADNGSRLFTVTFATAGKQRLTATDIASRSVAGSVSVRVGG